MNFRGSEKTVPLKIVLILAPCVLMLPVLLGRAIFWGTPILQFHPWRVFAWEALQVGELPLWNHLVGMGAPLLANYQSAFFYPLNWMYFLLAIVGGEIGMAWGQGLLVVTHLVIAGFGVAYLVRCLGLNSLAQVVAGLAYSLSGSLVARAGFLSINITTAWIPWILWATTRLMDNKSLSIRVRIKDFLLLSTLLTLQLLGGHAQTTWYTILLTIGWIGFWSWSSFWSTRDEKIVSQSIFTVSKKLFSNLIYYLEALFLAVGLASVQLLPTAELLMESQRGSGVDYAYAMNFSLWPWRLLTLAAPNFFGNPAFNDYWGFGNYWEDAIYIGFIPLMLVFYSIVLLRNQSVISDQHRSPVLFLLGVVFISIILAFGQNTPVFPWIYRNVPTFDMFQAPTRFSIWMVISLVLLAAYGAHYWGKPKTRKGRRWAERFIVIGLGTVMSSLGTGYVLKDIEPTYLSATTLMGIWIILAGLLTLKAPIEDAGSGSRIWILSAGCAVALELLIAGWGLNPSIDLGVYHLTSGKNEKVQEMLGTGRLYIGEDDEQVLKFKKYFRFDHFGGDWQTLRDSYLPNMQMMDGVKSANNFDPLVPGRFAAWMDYLNEVNWETKIKMLNFMGVMVVEKLESAEELSFGFYQNQGASLVRWSPCGVFVESQEGAWSWLLENDFSLAAPIALEDSLVGLGGAICDKTGYQEFEDYEEAINRLTINVNNTDPGWLLISNVWYPGWQAIVDGVEVSVVRGNYLFQAVPVPSNADTVELVYSPKSLKIGIYISLVSLGLVIVLGIRFSRLKDV